ncbi:YicC/YloC family endoribonuclease [Alkalihalobacillus sp. AL-G]|uniref:YicC/YloC family endoribonuclease n=1 Tax=Alkalihalobacillus sp. AL-G TaxID=2926399 RepID=UPI00272B7221|nr:YicC/YloC family endoribonuclease [Alkalihalobacillus sp. AL-G]WLD95099.1 YicC family protein [Alkalihalobacillus sp. AL-G]
MIKSMTGYGRSYVEEDHFSITTEIKSVNHRFCEIVVRMPRYLTSIEDKVKRTISKYIHRGKVDISIMIDGVEGIDRELEVDWGLLDQYVQAQIELRNRYEVNESIDYDDLLSLPDVVSIRENEHISEEFAASVLKSVTEAAGQLVQMREKEGNFLNRNLMERLSRMESIIENIGIVAPEVYRTYETRLYKKIKELSDGYVDADESRIVTEVALFADKSNIDEELTRLQSHIQQFRSIFVETESVGRKLDFLVQEINRECNTIGSKANDYSISKNVVELKSEIEKVKEQVQNIE